MQQQRELERPRRGPRISPRQKRTRVLVVRTNVDEVARLDELADARAEDRSKVVRAGLAELAEGAREVEQLRQIAAGTEDEGTRRDLQRLIDEKAERVGYRRG